jgi:hypothetical protein
VSGAIVLRDLSFFTREPENRGYGRSLIETRSAIKLYASGGSYDELHADLRAHQEYLEPHMDQSWKITFESINHNVTEKRQR